MEQEQKQQIKLDQGKPKLSMLFDFPHALIEVAQVIQDANDGKYERNDWKSGGPMTESIDSLLRHALAFHNCEDDDIESNKSHLAHIIGTSLILLENYHRFGGGIDDRDWEHQDAQD